MFLTTNFFDERGWYGTLTNKLVGGNNNNQAYQFTIRLEEKNKKTQLKR